MNARNRPDIVSSPSMRTDAFDYVLPPDRIAQHPASRRQDARMLVVDRASGRLAHRQFTDFPSLFQPDDVLILNDTRVIPARMVGRKHPSGGRVEVFFLEDLGDGDWEALLRSSRRPRPGSTILLGSGVARAEVVSDLGDGRCVLRIDSPSPFPAVLDTEGATPLPPYIHRGRPTTEELSRDRERYQTVYAESPGAVAAPTAGLHFTEEMIAAIRARGIQVETVTLHVGMGTFRPVSAENVADHEMASERYLLPPATADAIREARSRAGRIVAVGSTSVRTLETCSDESGEVRPGSGRTDLFIYPPYAFRAVDMMLTNFHLPRSTLLMMVCALGGRDLILQAYREAVRLEYRFYSYGDCMLIL